MPDRRFNVIKPSNEKELGDHLREKALASGVLNLIIREQLSELDKKRGNEPAEEEVTMRYHSLHRGDFVESLPFLVGVVSRASKGTATEGLLKVTGSYTDPEEKRKLELHIYEE